MPLKNLPDPTAVRGVIADLILIVWDQRPA